jgi:hypothetical protein
MISSILILSLSGTLAFADTPPAATAEASDARSGEQALVCRSQPRRGSRIAREVCRPSEKWLTEERRIHQPTFGWGHRFDDGGASGCYGSGC